MSSRRSPPGFAEAAEIGELPNLSPDYYSGEIEAFPKRVMVLDFSEEELAPIAAAAAAE